MSIARSVISRISIFGTTHFKGTPEDIAKIVILQAGQHQWMDDDLPSDEFESTLPFDEGAIGALRQARIKVGPSLAYLNCCLPIADDFPAWSNVLELHRDLIRARTIEKDLAVGAVLNLADSTYETFEKATRWLQEFIPRNRSLAGV